MAIEIERKFLVDPKVWKPEGEGVSCRQGYLSSVKQRVVRVRVAGSEAFLTVKGISENVSRLEFEYPIPRNDAEIILDRLCERPLSRRRGIGRELETRCGRSTSFIAKTTV